MVNNVIDMIKDITSFPYKSSNSTRAMGGKKINVALEMQANVWSKFYSLQQWYTDWSVKANHN